ncbi:MAG: GNAT family N-acetyltransferase [Succinivibrio sp.]|nr:GNAT family N-acetyltransferase [Succinivibrio sp.]
MARIRLAIGSDAKALIDILKQYIETSNTLDYTLPSEAEMEAKIRSISRNYPFIVIEDGDKILGYAYANLGDEASALSWNANLHTFIDLGARGHGYGQVVMRFLMDMLRLQNVQNAYSSYTESNPRSAAVHHHLGFNECGVLHKTGYKNGRWLDVNLLECRLTELVEPSPFIPFASLPKDQQQAVFTKYNQEIA